MPNQTFTRRIQTRQLSNDLFDTRQPANPLIQALTANAAGVTSVPGRDGYIYVRINADDDRTTVARTANDLVPNVWVYIRNIKPGLPGSSTSYEVVGYAPGVLISNLVNLSTPLGGTDNLQTLLEQLQNQISTLQGQLGGWGYAPWGTGKWGGVS